MLPSIKKTSIKTNLDMIFYATQQGNVSLLRDAIYVTDANVIDCAKQIVQSGLLSSPFAHAINAFFTSLNKYRNLIKSCVNPILKTKPCFVCSFFFR